VLLWVTDIITQVDRVIDALCSMDAPIESVQGHMNDLKKFSKKAQTTSKSVHNSFEKWQLIAMELWASCSNETAVVEGKQKALDEKLAFANMTVKASDAAVKEQGEMVKEWKTLMDDAKQDYKDVLEAFPGA
jgi:hypothetical protein